jgi:hypothetical protein
MKRAKLQEKYILLCRQLACIISLYNKRKGSATMTKQKNIKVVIVEPRKPARLEVIVNNLTVLQKLVGGYIECIKQEGYDIIINEEGKLMDLEPNFGLYGGMDFVAGTAIFAGVNYDEGEFKSLTTEQILEILTVFSGREK